MGEWCKSYLEDLGMVAADSSAASKADTTQKPNPQPTGPTGRPASDGGAPANPVRPAGDDVSLLDMSNEDRAAYISRHGLAKYNEKLRADMKGRKVAIRR